MAGSFTAQNRNRRNPTGRNGGWRSWPARSGRWPSSAGPRNPQARTFRSDSITSCRLQTPYTPLSSSRKDEHPTEVGRLLALAVKACGGCPPRLPCKQNNPVAAQPDNEDEVAHEDNAEAERGVDERGHRYRRPGGCSVRIAGRCRGCPSSGLFRTVDVRPSIRTDAAESSSLQATIARNSRLIKETPQDINRRNSASLVPATSAGPASGWTEFQEPQMRRHSHEQCNSDREGRSVS